MKPKNNGNNGLIERLKREVKKFIRVDEVDVVLAVTVRMPDGEYRPTIEYTKVEDMSKLRINMIKTEINDVHMSRYLDGDRRVESVVTRYVRTRTHFFGRAFENGPTIETTPYYEPRYPNS